MVKTAGGSLVILTLEDMLYIPDIKRFLVSLNCTSNNTAKFAFGKDIAIVTLSYGG